MPIQFYNLQNHLSHADMSHSMQSLFQNATQAASELAANEVKNQAKRQQNMEVQDSKQSENRIIESDSRGARSFVLTKEQHKEEEKKDEKKAEDPDGRGKLLDLQT